jgi:glycosyltransferase involved in cell wall biosynthesis
MNSHAGIIIPCYNEEHRLRKDALWPLLDRADVRLVLVDDGSTDGTKPVLRTLADQAPERIDVLPLTANRGKAEAVRAGLRHALHGGADIVGYADADMATPAGELIRLLDTLHTTGASAVLGSRVAVLGADIERKHTRHYLGRVFATCASLVLRAPVYDTQCGAKFFRRTTYLEAALDAPFRSRWAFDVELIGRIMARAGGYRAAGIMEVPLRHWRDVQGSKIKPTQMLKAGLDLATIAWELERLRKR